MVGKPILQLQTRYLVFLLEMKVVIGENFQMDFQFRLKETWPPTITPVWIAVQEDGVVVDRIYISLKSNLSNVLAGNMSTTQFVNCSSTEIRYFPKIGFSGTDYLTYSISDGVSNSTGLVTISVDPVPASPTPVLHPLPLRLVLQVLPRHLELAAPLQLSQ
mmetsp:Transcript_20613/g.28933  ORF Transcript_20613/g.28933 Transcript_20613/m.28933 type:complete len:161 (+) Transcript_20613:509-991(+)